MTIPRGRARAPVAAIGGGGVGPLVSFDGTTNYINGFAQANSSTLTIAGRIVLDGNPAPLDSIFGFYYGAMRFSSAIGTRQIQLNLINSGFTTIVDAEDGVTWSDGDVLSFVVAIDLGGGLSGSKSVSCYINGSEAISSTTSGGTLALNSDEPLSLMGIDGGIRYVQAESNGFWLSRTAVDPQSYWSSFFDGSNQWQASIPTNGTIEGATPFFWQNGNATAWNSGSDNNSNGYTMNGTVTAVI